VSYSGPAKAILFKEPEPSNFQKVRDFHNAFECPGASKITIPDRDTIALRFKLIDEEVKELRDEFYEYDGQVHRYHEDLDVPNIAKELADILYVVYGFGDVMGFPMDKVFAEVHR